MPVRHLVVICRGSEIIDRGASDIVNAAVEKRAAGRSMRRDWRLVGGLGQTPLPEHRLRRHRCAVGDMPPLTGGAKPRVGIGIQQAHENKGRRRIGNGAVIRTENRNENMVEYRLKT